MANKMNRGVSIGILGIIISLVAVSAPSGMPDVWKWIILLIALILGVIGTLKD